MMWFDLIKARNKYADGSGQTGYFCLKSQVFYEVFCVFLREKAIYRDRIEFDKN